MVRRERRFELRDITADAHGRLDATVGSFSTIEEYRRYVVGLSSFRSAMDGVLQRLSWPPSWGWRPTEVVEALRQDERALGLPPSPDMRPDLRLSDRSSLLGALYVLEGATLGARLLKRRAAELGLGEANGAKHLALMSGDISQWQAFLALLESAEDFNLERAGIAANDVFAFAQRCFEREPVVVIS